MLLSESVLEERGSYQNVASVNERSIFKTLKFFMSGKPQDIIIQYG